MFRFLPKINVMSRIILFIFIFSALFLIVTGLYFTQLFIEPVDPFLDDLIIVNVPSGVSARRVAFLLKEKELIHNELFFRVYARFFKKSSSIRSGEMQLARSMRLEKIFEVLTAPREIKESVKVTFPEGFTINEIAARLDNCGIVKSSFFLGALRKSIPKEFISLAGNNPQGMIFPDTYNFYKDSNAKDVVQRLSKYHLSVIQSFPEKGFLNLNRYQCIILASIIEKECLLDDERPKVARVFLNRLKKGIKLESCATVIHALGTKVKRLNNKDLEIDSPYNTYMYEGLPPHPICCPGKSSIKAVFEPSEGNWLYFVATGKGGHKFSSSLKKHNYYKRQYKKYIKSLKRKGKITSAKR